MKTIIANFKSHKTRAEYEHWIHEFSHLSLPSKVQVILAPPFVDLGQLADTLHTKKHDSVSLGIQDISPFPAGAYTGAISARNLEGFDVKYAVVGHSERRRYFHETDNDVANKVREALLASITPIVCVTKDTVQSQAHALEPSDRKHVWVAFEPVDHIGTGIADTLEDILSTRLLVQEAFGSVPYIYGGSVDPHTESAILSHPDIDGFLVGSASLDVHVFADLLHAVA